MKNVKHIIDERIFRKTHDLVCCSANADVIHQIALNIQDQLTKEIYDPIRIVVLYSIINQVS